jgi:hypothetical protein
MYGFGLAFFLEPKFRKTAAKLALSRPLRGFMDPPLTF